MGASVVHVVDAGEGFSRLDLYRRGASIPIRFSLNKDNKVATSPFFPLFTEGFEISDLRQAKVLLAELAG